MSIGSRVTWSNGDGSTSIIIFGGINMNKHPLASYIRVPSGSQSQYPFDSQPLWTPEVGHGLHQKCLRMGIHTFSNTVGWIYIYACMCTYIIYRKHTHMYIHIHIHIYIYIIHTHIYISRSLVKSPQWEPSIPQQLNRNVIRGGRVKRAQLLWNVHKFCETCTTSCKRGQLLWIRWQVLKHCKKLLIRPYPHTHIYIIIYIYMHTCIHAHTQIDR